MTLDEKPFFIRKICGHLWSFMLFRLIIKFLLKFIQFDDIISFPVGGNVILNHLELKIQINLIFQYKFQRNSIPLIPEFTHSACHLHLRDIYRMTLARELKMQIYNKIQFIFH